MPAFRAAIQAPTSSLPSIFIDDYRYVRDALNWLSQQAPSEQNPVQADDTRRTLCFQPNKDLALLLRRDLAVEMWPADNQFALCADKGLIEAAIKSARDTNAWPQVHFLWPLHPIVQWLDYKVMALFGRQKAPVIRAPQGLGAGESFVIILGQVPNRRGQTVLTEWMGVRVDARGIAQETLGFEAMLQRLGLNGVPLANDGKPIDASVAQAALPAVIQSVERHLKPIKQAFDADCQSRLGLELVKLKALQDRHLTQLELDYSRGIEQVNAARRKQRESDTADLFKQYKQWIRDTLELDDRAQFTVVAAIVG
jgi:hypothetical protein